MADLSPEVEQQLASMSEGEWAVLQAKVRAPDTHEQLRAEAAKVLGGDEVRADAFAAVARLDQFTTDGQIDPAKVARGLNQLLGVRQPTPQWGQSSGAAPGPQAGDGARAELAKRFGGKADSHPVGTPIRKGQAGRDAAARRFPSTSEERK